MNKSTSEIILNDEEMYHSALDQILRQSRNVSGQLGTISMTMRHAPEVGRHVHARATVKHIITATVDSNPTPSPKY